MEVRLQADTFDNSHVGLEHPDVGLEYSDIGLENPDIGLENPDVGLEHFYVRALPIETLVYPVQSFALPIQSLTMLIQSPALPIETLVYPVQSFALLVQPFAMLIHALAMLDQSFVHPSQQFAMLDQSFVHPSQHRGLLHLDRGQLIHALAMLDQSFAMLFRRLSERRHVPADLIQPRWHSEHILSQDEASDLVPDLGVLSDLTDYFTRRHIHLCIVVHSSGLRPAARHLSGAHSKPVRVIGVSMLFAESRKTLGWRKSFFKKRAPRAPQAPVKAAAISVQL